ncbi:phosphoenolpyruvate carboxykinase [Tyzzerella sp. An114]|uniref:phosphoenolpyruvate carboxykinase (ATP) n=1 Tax=Tyzzerella sp. An114 TaxID=1965545 RepID=UPI000B450BE6|nr:phosphoenolpyruvate carboxykinase (ATP) [Tyzzerella sp. An114]OUQ59182.1 phosphoenolpyruvate carboxykinase [Tyzzerella sp. An114]HIT73658.1 phosphoenolpyruvate carboxykinase (ATP) [Candidatus Fimicola cottocaccae]
MSTKANFRWDEVRADNPLFSAARTTIETAFYGNNVVKVNSLKEAYKLAKNSPGTIVTDMPVERPEEIGLDEDAKILVFNDGAVFGRTAAARRIAGEPGVDVKDLCTKIRDAVYNTRYKKMYHAQAYIGLDKDFMVKAHMLLPEGEENLMYNWLLNFQYITDEYTKMYKDSKPMENEGDIYFFADPSWSHPDHPLGLAFFDPTHNCAAVLGMRYFGELKKGTLTLAWGIANRNGYASCHGGQKRYNLENGRKFVAGVFGLSGSGKSTITHAKHGGKYDVTVLHDDAFVISTENGSSVALEPSYFDKTQDYPLMSPDNKYLLSVQNVGATIDENGKTVIVTEDLRNGNGRAIKSKLWSPNRVDKFDEPVNAIFWLMKDPTMPPILKIKGAALSSAMGACLATKRTTAERLAPGVDPDALVFEPYANPFRTFPLSQDYLKFKALFEERNVDCYILNTGFLMDKKITPAVTLGCLEAVIEDRATFKKWANFSDFEIMEVEGFVPDMNDPEYKAQLTARMKDRLEFIKSRDEAKGGFDKLPAEVEEVIAKVISEL